MLRTRVVGLLDVFFCVPFSVKDFQSDGGFERRRRLGFVERIHLEIEEARKRILQ